MNQTYRNVGLVMLLSTLARGLSLVASMRYTAWFGYTLETDIYSYAVNLPNLVFTCIGTALVTVVIPIFSGRLAAREHEKAYGFIDNILSVSLILAGVIALAGILASPLIVGMIGKFRTGDPALALFALRLMFPIVLFHALSYILQGVLQSNGRFLAPALVSAFSGLSVILYVELLAGRFGIRGLLTATFAGLASQAVFLAVPAVKSVGYRWRPALDLTDPDLRRAGRLALPVLVSSSSYQFNMFVNSTFAAGFDGGVLTVTNMQTLAFTAAQLFIISALTVYFPRMSASYATGDMKGYRGELSSVLRLTAVFAVPASAALAFLSHRLIPLIYGHGRVTAQNIEVSAAVFAVYAASIASIGFKEAADRAFYAAGDSRTPAAIGVLIMALNIALSAVLKGRFGLVGLPVAYAAAISVGAAALLLILYIRLKIDKKAAVSRVKIDEMAAGGLRGAAAPAEGNAAGTPAAAAAGGEKTRAAAIPTVAAVALATAAMLAALFAADALIYGVADRSAGEAGCSALSVPGQAAQPVIQAAQPVILAAQPVILAARFAALVAVGGGVYAAAAYLLGVAEIRSAARALRRKK